MKRYYFLSDNLDKLADVEHDLAEMIPVSASAN